MNNNGIEIERKFLIRYPDPDYLAANGTYTDITQIYLGIDGSGMSERIRKRGRDGEYTYTHTYKKTLNAMRRIEVEDEISEEDFRRLSEKADPERTPVIKRRWCLEYRGQLFEIDLYPFWSDRAIMEIELESEQQSVYLPESIAVIKEVTDDRRYRNSAIAVSIPQESL